MERLTSRREQLELDQEKALERETKLAAIEEKIGIRWRAATAPEEADGYVRLLKNDGPRGTVVVVARASGSFALSLRQMRP